VYINAQNNRYWSSINLRQTSEVPLHIQKIAVYCVIAVTQTAGPIAFEQTINSEHFFGSIMEEKKTLLSDARW
jgi:hypothetical protein